MSDVNYKVLDCNFDWTEFNDTTSVHYIHPGSVLAIRCDFFYESGNSNSNFPSAGVTLPADVTLLFEGGSFSGAPINGDNTKIVAPITKIFDTSVVLNGTFVYETFYPEWYGAKGDNETNDFLAFNSTFTFASHVTLTQKYHIYGANETSILVTGKKDFTLIGYESLINNTSEESSNEYMDNFVFTFEKTENLTIKGITINGNGMMARGIKINDIPNVTLDDIIIKKLYNNTLNNTAIGIDLRVVNGSIVQGNNVRISDIKTLRDYTIDDGDPMTDGVGITRAVFITVDYRNADSLPSNPALADYIEISKKTKIMFDNSVFEWMYGDDGDVIDIKDELFISDALHRFIFTNCTIRYATRRLVKGSASGIQYYHCKFDTASIQELNPTELSGGVNFRNADSNSKLDFRNKYGRMINCEYRDTGNLNQETAVGGFLIIDHTDGIEISGCSFFDTSIRVQNKAGNFKIFNNTFYNSSIQIEVHTWDEGRSYITNNKGHFPSPITVYHPALINSDSDLKSIVIDGNKVFSDEAKPSGPDPVPGLTTNFFGLLRHARPQGTPQLEADEVYVSGNHIIRTNNPNSRSEYLRSSERWINCKIFNNFINLIRPTGVGANFFQGDFVGTGPDRSIEWGNYDGAGDNIGIV